MSEHYKQEDVETIDFIEQTVKHYPPEMAFHIGNALKYISRAPHKDAMGNDIDKAIDYLYRARHGKWMEDNANDI